jgi:hypothetical protein
VNNASLGRVSRVIRPRRQTPRRVLLPDDGQVEVLRFKRFLQFAEKISLNGRIETTSCSHACASVVCTAKPERQRPIRVGITRNAKRHRGRGGWLLALSSDMMNRGTDVCT